MSKSGKGGTLRILSIAGSLRRVSYNRAALHAAVALAPAGITPETFELNGVPGLNQNDEQQSPVKVAVMGALIGVHETALARYHLRRVFVFLNMNPLNRFGVMIANASERLVAAGRLVDDNPKQLIHQLLDELTAWTRQRRLQHLRPMGRRLRAEKLLTRHADYPRAHLARR